MMNRKSIAIIALAAVTACSAFPIGSLGAEASDSVYEEQVNADENAAEDNAAVQENTESEDTESADVTVEDEADVSADDEADAVVEDEADTETDTADDESSSAMSTEEAAAPEQEPAAPKEESVFTNSKEVEIATIGADLGDEDDLFKEYANTVFYPETGSSSKMRKAPRVSAGSHLEGQDLLLYTELKNAAADIANGNRDSSVVSIPFTDLGIEERMYSAEELGLPAGTSLTDDTTGDLTEAAENAILEKAAGGYETVIDCLVADCAYELYWSSGSFGYAAQLTYSYNSTGVNFSSSVLNISMYVNPVYVPAGGSNTDVDTDKTSAASNAAEYAGQIVSETSEMSDLDKLIYYKDSICELVTYDEEAAESAVHEDKSPWALINVFDRDPDTNVVCEGYSEAFQYLASLTEFDNNNVSVYSVTGTMTGATGEGPHKWNIVRMNDGKNYIADITNSDEDSVGSDGKLFLTGMTGSPADGYAKQWEEREEQIDNGDGSYSIITYPAGSISYEYDKETKNIFSEQELTLSETDYDSTYTGVSITSQPSDVEVAAGETVTFTVEAEGDSLNYQWQFSTNGTTWKNCTSGGYNTDTFGFTMKASLSGRQYRCIVSDGTQTVTSEAATVTLAENDLEITAQPEDIEVAAGDTVVFHVEANKSDATYQWQFSTKDRKSVV